MKLRFIQLFTVMLSLTMLGGLMSCEEELQLPDNLVGFESDQQGITSSENELLVNIALSREATEDGTIEISYELNGLEYGVDFTTDPAATDGKITLTVDKGTTSVAFKVIKADGALFDGDEVIVFTISSIHPSLVLGEKSTFSLTFAEIIAPNGKMDPNVGGEQQPNKVFVDLSANRQTSIGRGEWDLGFYTVDGEFRVILNSSSSMLARPLDKTDMNSVTASDTVGWGAQLSTDAIFSAVLGPPPAWISNSINWIDAPDGDMTKTAIAAVSATESENKVYIVNRGKNPNGSPRGWKKIRVLRNGSGYTLQHADINATSFQTVQIEKDDDYLFNYVNFNSGAVEVEPEKGQWDIAFTVFTNSTALAGPPIPYVYQDIVLQNRFEVETAVVMTSAIAYDQFDEEDLNAVIFKTSQLGIGATWRTGAGPGMAPTLNTAIYYIVKDAAGNIYKLKFTALSQGGERGRPQIEFVLVKKGS